MEIGEHCTLTSCNTLTFLPINCAYCHSRFCQSHFLPLQHDCKASGAAEADRKLSETEVLLRIQRANTRRREVQQGNESTLTDTESNELAVGPSKLPCQKAGCKQYTLQLDPTSLNEQAAAQQIEENGVRTKVKVIHAAPRCERCHGFFCMTHRSVQAHGCTAHAPPTIGDKRRDAAKERKLKAQEILNKNFPNRNKK